ncbi:MAG: DNA-processing protein DprA [Succinivibrionaceae bacterium]|nr:DNA-processing protein DprA [Succinivibrionaceae bacterium]
MHISENELVTLLLCSDLAINDHQTPLSDAAYSAFAMALFKEGKEPKDLLSMRADDILSIYEKYKSEVFSHCRTSDFHQRIPSLLKRHQQLTIVLSNLETIGLNVVTRANKDLYPKKIRNKLRRGGAPIPSVLFYAGDISLIDRLPAVAIVGSRDLTADSTADRFTREFAATAINSGYAISSGGAKGIDQLALETAISSGGRSIITVSDSLKKKIREPSVRNEIINGDSLFLSMTSPDARFAGYNAMARNKMIYAAADYSMVVTCDYKTENRNGRNAISMTKGGTWVGAHECATRHLSNLMVRDSSNALKGNAELIKTIDCIPVREDDVFNGASFDQLIQPQQGHQTDLFQDVQP